MKDGMINAILFIKRLSINFRVLCIALLLLVGCSSNKTKPVQSSTLFSLLPSSATGVDFSNIVNYTEQFNVYTYRNFYNGGGVAIGDINNDGLPDIFFCGNQL